MAKAVQTWIKYIQEKYYSEITTDTQMGYENDLNWTIWIFILRLVGIKLFSIPLLGLFGLLTNPLNNFVIIPIKLILSRVNHFTF